MNDMNVEIDEELSRALRVALSTLFRTEEWNEETHLSNKEEKKLLAFYNKLQAHAISKE